VIEDEELSEEMLPLAPTRPNLLLGIPFEVAVPLGGVGYLVMMFTDGFIGILYAAIMVAPLWFGLRFLVARDYHAPRILWKWLTDAALCWDAAEWGGISVSHFPLSDPVSLTRRLRCWWRGQAVANPRGIRRVF
jgi:type IV secretory pathway VirB3-like protein